MAFVGLASALFPAGPVEVQLAVGPIGLILPQGLLGHLKVPPMIFETGVTGWILLEVCNVHCLLIAVVEAVDSECLDELLEFPFVHFHLMVQSLDLFILYLQVQLECQCGIP